MTKVYSLKNGKSYTAPSLFVNPQTNDDVKSLWTIDGLNKLNNIDGIYIALSDYKQLSPKLGFSQQPLFNENRMTLRDKIFLIDPSLDKLLTGMDVVKQKMFATGIFDRRILKTMKEIKLSDLTTAEKSLKILEEVYPQLQVKPLIDFQVKSNVDMIISPCIPISSKNKLVERFNFAERMLRNTRILLDSSSLKKYNDTKSLMNILTLSKTIISNERNFHRIFDLLLCNTPDHVGIKTDKIEESDTQTQLTLFKFFREFQEYARHITGNKSPPMHFINVNELGYVSYCNAVSNIICPIGHSPYYPFMRKKGGGNATATPVERDTSMKYYHPINMDYPKFALQTPFPCACNECEKRYSADNVPYNERPLHNRKHWLEVKDGEIREFRETPIMLNIALRDKLARANRTQLIAYIPPDPVFAHIS